MLTVLLFVSTFINELLPLFFVRCNDMTNNMFQSNNIVLIGYVSPITQEKKKKEKIKFQLCINLVPMRN